MSRNPHPWLWTLVAAGCSTAPPVPVVNGAPVSTVVTVDPPTIRSVHVSRFDVPALGGADAVLVVLSSEVDPLGVRASAFSLALADGRRVTPERASVWPAHERGEHRSVLLEADLVGPGSSPPVNLTVVEHVFTADGRDLRGATAPVRPFEEPDSLIAWARVKPGETDCPNGEPAVRTFWSDLVRADENIVEVVRLLRADGSEVAATAVGDREDAEKADNVLDFCTTDPGGVVGLRISDAVTDLAGHPVQSAIAAVDRT